MNWITAIMIIGILIMFVAIKYANKAILEQKIKNKELEEKNKKLFSS